MQSAPDQHTCHVTAAGSDVISSDWCIRRFAPILMSLPAELREEDVACPELLIHDETVRNKRVQIYYTPFDLVNPDAKVLLVGITPGRYQMHQAVMAARAALLSGTSLDDAIRRANETASFAGPMRSNAVAMLDGIGLAGALNIDSTATLFDRNSAIAGSTSAVCHAVFVDGTNYTGHGLEKLPILAAFTTQVLGTELMLTPDALVVPFGRAASQAVHACADAGYLDRNRCLFGFPHPSGGNGHRASHFARDREQLSHAVSAWASRL